MWHLTAHKQAAAQWFKNTEVDHLQTPLTTTDYLLMKIKIIQQFLVIYKVSGTFKTKQNKRREDFFYLLWNYKTYWLFVCFFSAGEIFTTGRQYSVWK